jgi:hypothetical protein
VAFLGGRAFSPRAHPGTAMAVTKSQVRAHLGIKFEYMLIPPFQLHFCVIG